MPRGAAGPFISLNECELFRLKKIMGTDRKEHTIDARRSTMSGKSIHTFESHRARLKNHFAFALANV